VLGTLIFGPKGSDFNAQWALNKDTMHQLVSYESVNWEKVTLTSNASNIEHPTSIAERNRTNRKGLRARA
jgi:hypothetical protein